VLILQTSPNKNRRKGFILLLKKNLLKRTVMMLAGVAMLGFGISLNICSGLGTDPFTCFNLGVSQKFGINYALWQCIANAIILIFTLLFARNLVGPGTVVSMTMVGISASAFRSYFQSILPAQPQLLPRVLLMIAGVLFVGIGAALYISAKVGISPYDSIGFIGENITHIEFRWCRIVCDVTAVLIGWALGSAVGVGTVITAFCMGPFIRYFGRVFTKNILREAP
jgi:uncharacterized protein